MLPGQVAAKPDDPFSPPAGEGGAKRRMRSRGVAPTFAPLALSIETYTNKAEAGFRYASILGLMEKAGAPS